MSTLYDVQNAMVNVITPIVYPNTTASPSILGSQISSIAVGVGGTGYTTATISFTGGGGSGAIAQATILAGAISSITVIDGGYGYTSIPTVVITGNGTSASATAALSVLPVFVFAGDPLKEDLDAQLAQHQSIISVFAVQGMTRNTTRIRREFTDPLIQVATIFMTVAGNTITISGSVTANEATMAIVNGTGYSYQVLATDTLNTIASSLAALIPTASAVGAVITITNAYDIVARVSVPGTARQVLHSQDSMLRARIITWRAEVREILGAAVQIGFGVNGYYLPMPDLISASIKPARIAEVNTNELALAFARDYLYLVEYHTVQVGTFQTIADPFTLTTLD